MNGVCAQIVWSRTIEATNSVRRFAQLIGTPTMALKTRPSGLAP